MLKRFGGGDIAVRLFVVAGLVVLLMLSALSSTGSRYSPAEDAPDQSSEAQNGAQKDDGVPGWWRVVQRLIAAEDTLAQWLLTFFSVLAVLVSAIAVYWVKMTYDATVAGSKVNRRIGEAQVRAYLVFVGVEAVQQKSSDGIITGIAFNAILKNTGQSPAEVFDLRSAVGNRPTAEDDFQITFPAHVSFRTRMEVGSGQTAHGNSPVIPIDIFMAIAAQGHWIYIYAEAAYHDVFYYLDRFKRPARHSYFAALVQADSRMAEDRMDGNTFGVGFTYAELSRFKVEGGHQN